MLWDRSRIPIMLTVIRSLHAAPKNTRSLWLAEDAGKRWTEVFFLVYSPFWMIWALCVLVPFRLYDVRRCSSGTAGAPFACEQHARYRRCRLLQQCSSIPPRHRPHMTAYSFEHWAMVPVSL